MKTSVILAIVACGLIAGAVIYLNRSKTSPAPAPVAEATPAPAQPSSSEKLLANKPEAPSAPASNAVVPPPVTVPTFVAVDTNSSPSDPIGKAVDTLLSARSGKHEMFEQLRKSGQLDAVISELQKRAAADPGNPEIPTTLGEAMLNKVRALHEAGNEDPNEIGILAMQADQNFNTALKIDPKNWEAQFVKYSSMTYWPVDPARDASTVQHLSSLIDQQEGMPSQPEFVQPYLMLIKEYQKMGNDDAVKATVQLGLQKFPGDPSLLKLANGP